MNAYIIAGFRSAVGKAPRGKFRFTRPDDLAAKVIQHLVRSGIMRSTKGSKGGVTLAMPPREISLLNIVEACQGKILAEYCEDYTDDSRLCGLHKAMMQLNGAITQVLTQWTVQTLVDNPTPHDSVRDHINCKLRNVCAMCNNCVFD